VLPRHIPVSCLCSLCIRLLLFALDWPHTVPICHAPHNGHFTLFRMLLDKSYGTTWPAAKLVQPEYLERTVRRREVGEVLVVAGRAPACWLVWRGMQYRRSQAFVTELETSTRTQSKRMTNHNTPQLSGMDSANHCAVFPGLSALSTTTVHSYIVWFSIS
jgi:hypothetical protein